MPHRSWRWPSASRWSRSLSLPTAEVATPALAISFAHFFVGLTCIISQRNILKQIFGYCLMENGSHVTLAPARAHGPRDHRDRHRHRRHLSPSSSCPPSCVRIWNDTQSLDCPRPDRIEGVGHGCFNADARPARLSPSVFSLIMAALAQERRPTASLRGSTPISVAADPGPFGRHRR